MELPLRNLQSTTHAYEALAPARASALERARAPRPACTAALAHVSETPVARLSLREQL